MPYAHAVTFHSARCKHGCAPQTLSFTLGALVSSFCCQPSSLPPSLNHQASQDDLVAQVDKDLRTMLLKPDAPKPRVVGVRVWPRAIPQFNVGHLETLDKAKQVGPSRQLCCAARGTRPVCLAQPCFSLATVFQVTAPEAMWQMETSLADAFLPLTAWCGPQTGVWDR